MSENLCGRDCDDAQSSTLMAGSAAACPAGIWYLRMREGEGCSGGEVIRPRDSSFHVVSDKSFNLLVSQFLIL